MSKNRREWYELALFFAWIFCGIAVLSLVSRICRRMTLTVTLFWMILAMALFVIAWLIRRLKR